MIPALAVLIWMSLMFLVAWWKRDNTVADIAWGLGFIVAVGTAFILRGGSASPRQILVLGLVIIWGVRLAFHLWYRSRGQGEDPRYLDLRKKWGKSSVWRSFTHVFLLQGLLLFIIASPALIVQTGVGRPLGLLDMIGVAVWTLGLVIEAVADLELVRFKRNPANRGKVLQSGLWSLSRHPNYFGEVTLWWGMYLIALSVYQGWLSIAGPLLITFLIFRVSGIPLLESRYADSPDYQRYKKRTSQFIPWFPKNEK